jgi:hypothetical protein
MTSRLHGPEGLADTAYPPGSDAPAIVDALARSRLARSRVSIRDLVYLAAIIGAILVALGWRWDTPGQSIRALEGRVTVTEKRIDTLSSQQRFTNYLLCTQFRRTDAASTPPACTRVFDSMERP